MQENTKMTVVNERLPMSLDGVKNQVGLIQEVMRSVMKEGEHYGKIPGTPKPTLFQPGAQKLMLTFKLSAEPEIVKAVHEKDFISYTVKVTLYHYPTGNKMGGGFGSCNSRERKYRNVPMWDIDNTILKMSTKRAKVAAVLDATAASDIFTQDIEDMEPRSYQAPKYVDARLLKAKQEFKKLGVTESQWSEYLSNSSTDSDSMINELQQIYQQIINKVNTIENVFGKVEKIKTKDILK